MFAFVGIDCLPLTWKLKDCFEIKIKCVLDGDIKLVKCRKRKG